MYANYKEKLNLIFKLRKRWLYVLPLMDFEQLIKKIMIDYITLVYLSY